MKYFSNATLFIGVLVLVQGAIAFYLRLNIFTGTRYGPSLMPVYIMFSGVGVCLMGLTLRVILDRTKSSDSKDD